MCYIWQEISLIQRSQLMACSMCLPRFELVPLVDIVLFSVVIVRCCRLCLIEDALIPLTFILNSWYMLHRQIAAILSIACSSNLCAFFVLCSVKVFHPWVLSVLVLDIKISPANGKEVDILKIKVVSSLFSPDQILHYSSFVAGSSAAMSVDVVADGWLTCGASPILQ